MSVVSEAAADPENAAPETKPKAEAHKPEAYASLKVPDLRRMCEENNLPASGTKAELTSRLAKTGVAIPPKAEPRATPRRAAAKEKRPSALKRPSGLGQPLREIA